MYKPYISPTEYFGSVISEDDLLQMLTKASRNIDTITFNRIVAKGFDNLTEFQKEAIRDATVQLAEWIYENQEDLSTIFGGYSINGVSVNYANAPGIVQVNGVTVPTEVYDLVAQTGLCCLIAR